MRSALLEAAASELRHWAERTDHFSIESRHDWEHLFLNLEGQAIQGASAQLLHAAMPWAPTVAQMLRVAAITQSYVSTVRLVEELADAPLGFLSQYLRPATASALDALCAMEIRRVCAPIEGDPAKFFDAAAHAPFTVIHADALATLAQSAPLDVATDIAAQPDVTVLEAGPDHLVALVYPGGPSELDSLAEEGTIPASVTTLVPGVGSTSPVQWPSVIDHARSISQATGAPAIAWMGYNAPDSVLLASRSDPAQAGARELERFQHTVAKRWPGAQRIVVAHSYGSVVAGMATDVADDVVLVGSPGTTRDNADGIGSRVWSATNRDDPIALITGAHSGAFGPAPSEPEFGATPLPGADGRPGGHSDYWDDPAFYRGLAAIARRP